MIKHVLQKAKIFVMIICIIIIIITIDFFFIKTPLVTSMTNGTNTYCKYL